MKATELRIGNIVQGGNDPEMYVHDISLDGSVSLAFIGMSSKQAKNYGLWYYNIKYINPVPLTEEWLLKFGFEKKENGWFEIIYKVRYENAVDNLIAAHDVEISINATSNFVCICNTALKEERSISSTKNKVKYVHQLQNLFFALTGKELKIKNVKNGRKQHRSQA